MYVGLSGIYKGMVKMDHEPLAVTPYFYTSDIQQSSTHIDILICLTLLTLIRVLRMSKYRHGIHKYINVSHT